MKNTKDGLKAESLMYYRCKLYTGGTISILAFHDDDVTGFLDGRGYIDISHSLSGGLEYFTKHPVHFVPRPQSPPIAPRVGRCKHRKGKMIDFNEDTFTGTWTCNLCGEPFSRKASIVCTGALLEYQESLLKKGYTPEEVDIWTAGYNEASRVGCPFNCPNCIDCAQCVECGKQWMEANIVIAGKAGQTGGEVEGDMISRVAEYFPGTFRGSEALVALTFARREVEIAIRDVKSDCAEMHRKDGDEIERLQAENAEARKVIDYYAEVAPDNVAEDWLAAHPAEG